MRSRKANEQMLGLVGNLIIAAIVLTLLLFVGIKLYSIFHAPTSLDAKYCVNGLNGLVQSMLFDGMPTTQTFYCVLQDNEIVIAGNPEGVTGCNSRSLCITTLPGKRVSYKKAIKGVGKVFIEGETISSVGYLGYQSDEKGHFEPLVKMQVTYYPPNEGNEAAFGYSGKYGVVEIIPLPLERPLPQESSTSSGTPSPSSGLPPQPVDTQIPGTWKAGPGIPSTPNLADNEIRENGMID